MAWWAAEGEGSENGPFGTKPVTSQYARAKYGGAKAAVPLMPAALALPQFCVGPKLVTAASVVAEVAAEEVVRKVPAKKRPKAKKEESVEKIDTPTKDRAIARYDVLEMLRERELSKRKKVPMVKARIMRRIIQAKEHELANHTAESLDTTAVVWAGAGVAVEPVTATDATTHATTSATVIALDDDDVFMPDLDVSATRVSLTAMMHRVSMGVNCLVRRRSSISLPKNLGNVGARPSILSFVGRSAQLTDHTEGREPRESGVGAAASSNLNGFAAYINRKSVAAGHPSISIAPNITRRLAPAQRVLAPLPDAYLCPLLDEDEDEEGGGEEVECGVIGVGVSSTALRVSVGECSVAASRQGEDARLAAAFSEHCSTDETAAIVVAAEAEIAVAAAADAAATEEAFSSSLSLILECITAGEVLHLTAQVSKYWHRVSTTSFSWRVANEMMLRHGSRKATAPVTRSVVPTFSSWAPYLSAFPWGSFLADGAYKQVYKVWNAVAGRMEAVSTMDVNALAGTGNLPIIQAEIQCACLVSELVRAGTCPNFVETYQVFLHAYTPDVHFPQLWGCSSDKYPQSRSMMSVEASRALIPSIPLPRSRGEYQYIRMELCGGDLEGCLRLLEPHVVASAASRSRREVGSAAVSTAAARKSRTVGAASKLELATARAPVVALEPGFSERLYVQFMQSCLFQMVFGLYVARDKLTLRHYDIKLLNFLTKRIDGSDGSAPPTLSYTFGTHTFRLADSSNEDGARAVPAFDEASELRRGCFVKMADFGTADTRPDTLGGRITAYQFTTLENTPPEYLLYGDICTQAYSADTWNLGLCALHMLTGSTPYEEVFESILCPHELVRALTAVWMSDSQYTVVAHILEDDEDDVLCHTLYRYLVLLGVGSLPELSPSPLLAVLCATLSTSGKPTPIKLRSKVLLKAAEVAAIRALYASHATTHSLACGVHPLLQRARTRGAQLPGMLDLVQAMMAFEPTLRPTAKTMLLSTAFASLDVGTTDAAAVTGEYEYSSYSCADDADLPDV